ncbi:MAG: SMC-Scp complex subunit ScpB [Desulfomonile sp.]|nr:SMC-Scp complex subunit ScpB [Desulfomonile sp.]
MDRASLKAIVEGMIFAHPEPLSARAISGVIREASAETIQSVLDDLEREYRERNGGFVLSKVAGGYQFRSAPKVSSWVLELRKMKPSRLSRAALETLSIVAYNQPVTKSRIEQIRGVESSGPLRHLIERGLIEVAGRKDVPGRPLLYGTTQRFLEVFGLPDLASLPPLPEAEAFEEAVE